MSHDWLRSFRAVSFMTMISRVTGYMRDSALALYLGPGAVLDAYFVVTRIASMGRAFFAEGMVNVLLPSIAKETDIGDQKRLIFAIFLRIVPILFGISIFVSFYPEIILNIIAPGFKDERLLYASRLLSVIFWYLLQISIISLMNTMLNLKGKFILVSFLPCILNFALIISAYLIGVFSYSYMSLAYAVVCAGFVQMAAIYFILVKSCGSWKDSYCWYHQGIKDLIKVFVGAFASTGAVQCATLLDTVLATSLGAGAVSWVYYADRLVQLPLGILGVSMMTVLLPKFTKYHVDNESRGYEDTFCLGFESMCMLGLPITVMFFYLSDEIVSVLFAYGKFTLDDVYKTSSCLSIMSLALPAIMLNKLLAASSFAKQHVWPLMTASVIALLSNGIVAFALRSSLQQEAMALGMLCGSWVNFLCLYYIASPVSFLALSRRCRFKYWLVILAVFAFIIDFMHNFVHISLDLGLLHRFVYLSYLCLPALLFYALSCLYMWMPSLFFFAKNSSK